MKKILFLTLLSAFTLILVITSCSNNDYEETINSKMSKSRMTRAASSSITMEEVQERLDKLNEKYGTNCIIDKTCDVSCYDESFFIIIENYIRQSLDLEPLKKCYTEEFGTHNIMNDYSLYEVAVRSTDSNIEDNDEIIENIIYENSVISTKNLAIEQLNKNDVSPFINYEFNFHFSIYYEKSGTNEICFLKLDDNTVYSIENSNDNSTTADNVEEFKNRYKISYISNSLKLIDNDIKLQDDAKSKKAEELVNNDFEFTYTFQFKINKTTIESVSTHPNGGTLFNVIE